MQKKEITASSKLSLGFRCGDCLHLDKISKFEKVCSKLGITKNALAPACFAPNVFELQKVTPDILNNLGLMIKDLNSTQCRILLGLLKARKSFERYHLAFGQPVYFHVGQDYLSNYFKGFVVSVSSFGEPTVYVTSDLNKKQVAKPAMLVLSPESVFTISRFKKKKDSLVKRNLVNDPKPFYFMKKVHPKEVDVSYEPPTMESVPDSWFDVYAGGKGKDKAQNKSPIKKVKSGLEMKIRSK